MKQIYNYLLAIAVAACATINAVAQTVVTANGIKINDIHIEQRQERVWVDMLLDMSKLRVRSNHSLQLTPVLTNGEEMIQLPPIVIDGRRRWIVHEREKSDMYESQNTYLRRYNGKGQVLEYEADIPSEEWMQSSELVLREEWRACHDMPFDEQIVLLATFATSPDSTPEQQQDPHSATQPSANVGASIEPHLAYVLPSVDGARKVQNDVNIYFAVGSSSVNPAFMDNDTHLKQLVAIFATQSQGEIHLMGYASPEGSYEFNEGLALHRAEAVKEYLTRHNLGEQMKFTVGSSPTNWGQVKRLLTQSHIENWADIVAIIDDSAVAPSQKNDVIRAKYPVEYDFMLKNWYPQLRLTHIVLNSLPRKYGLEQIKTMMQSGADQPSLEDIYLVATTYSRGSKEWNEIILMAAECYPQSVQARLNAANVALASENYSLAEEYLRALPATLPEVMNTRGVLSMAQGRYSEAMILFRQAERDGVSEATDNIALLETLISESGN